MNEFVASGCIYSDVVLKDKRKCQRCGENFTHDQSYQSKYRSECSSEESHTWSA